MQHGNYREKERRGTGSVLTGPWPRVSVVETEAMWFA